MTSTTMTETLGIVEELDATVVDWSDMDAVNRFNASLLSRVAEPANLKILVDRVLATPDLREMCERHNLFNRLVLYSADERGFRIRLHVYHQPEIETIHDHRFPFTAYLLNGSYIHTTFEPKGDMYGQYDPTGAQDGGDTAYSEENFVETACDKLERGDFYTINSDIYHTVEAEKDTVSLMLRGPAEKEFCLFVTPADGGISNCISAENETNEVRTSKVLTDEELSGVVDFLKSKTLI
ncbi:hypothetical protein P5P81_05535 [Tritonibacter mobilis]|nr:hypothetical protein [Tritonibacter mobilis]